MSLRVLNAHTGQRLPTDPAVFGSLDSFKTWIAQSSSIPPVQQILLTAAGRQAKFPALTLESELFLYNRQLISPNPSDTARHASVFTISPPSVTPLPAAPDTVIDQNDLQDWQALFGARRIWAGDILGRSRLLNEEIQDHFEAITVIERAVSVAVGNLQSHVRNLQQKFKEASTWSQQLLEEPDTLLAKYNNVKSHLNHLPAKPTLLGLLPRLLTTTKSRNANLEDNSTLASFLSIKTVDEAATELEQATRLVADRIVGLRSAVESVGKSTEGLVKDIHKAQTETVQASSKDAVQLLEEIEVVTKKFESDYEHIIGISGGPKSLPQVFKMGSLHSRNHIPSLNEIYAELTQHLVHCISMRNSAASLALHQMQCIATIETNFARVNAQLIELDLSESGADALDTLSLISQLHLVYGSLLVETVRRREWADKLKSESAILAEDIAGYREEEEKRRKKWLKGFGHLVSNEAASGSALYFELNLQAENQEWPAATRDDVDQYLQALRGLAGMEDTMTELSEAVKDLDRPTRRQIKKVKGFKMGSIHETESGKGSFLLRSNDEIKALREINMKLDEELKSQKSRVRKLEDLVYKQAQPQRPTSGNIFHSDLPRPVSLNSAVDSKTSPANSPKQELLSRKASVNTRRTSGNTSADDKALTRRIVALEAELHEERQKSAEMQVGADNHDATIARLEVQYDEIQSTNKDLMANMEAQQREFADERRSLNNDSERYKLKIEELEDELDRVMGSRENERANEEDRVKSLEGQLETVLIKHKNELASRDETVEELDARLRSIHANLNANENSPGSTAELIDSIDVLIISSTMHQKELAGALASARSDNEALQRYLDNHQKQIEALRTQVRETDEVLSSTRIDSANEKAKAESLAADVEDGRNQLRILRAKFAEGETGSESLRQRLEEQASKASTLASQLAQSKSQVITLDVELSNVQRKNLKLEGDLGVSLRRLELRSGRDRELTHRLVEYNEELVRLLEALGLSIIERDGTMTIQRTSKLASASTLLVESTTSPSTPLSNAGHPFDVSIDPILQRWMQAESEGDEKARFTEFIARLSAFNISKFNEAVIKLRRDVEWTGKKWKAEARSYRDKAHRAQTESHDKIAYRSFKEGDLALFLPTRNQATRPWAAFNVGAPHYFLREQDSHKLQHREWLVARISKIEDRVVDLSKPPDHGKGVAGSDGRSIAETSEGGMSFDDDNPFELSDGLRWYLLDAVEEKSGAPSTPGLGKSTLASVQRVDAKGSIRVKKSATGGDASAKLGKSLESRRSSSSSKRGSISAGVGGRPVNLDTQGPFPSATAAGGTFAISAAAEELQRVASLTNLTQLRPGSARSSGPAALQPPTDEHTTTTAHSPPRPFLGFGLGLFGNPSTPVTPSPPKPSWFGRNTGDATSTLRRGIGQSSSSSPAARPSFVQTLQTHGQNERLEPRQPLLGTPSPNKPMPQYQQHLAAPAHVQGQLSRSASSSPAKDRRLLPQRESGVAAPAWEPLWSLDMSIEEGGGSVEAKGKGRGAGAGGAGT